MITVILPIAEDFKRIDVDKVLDSWVNLLTADVVTNLNKTEKHKSGNWGGL